MLIMRGLLYATKALERQLERRGVAFHTVVFVRTDIYDHLVAETPDRGKESMVSLEWDDPELFREIVRKLVTASTELSGDFGLVWQQVAPSLVGIEDAFTYLLDRTLQRPRDLLMFLSEAVQVALDRGHQQITQEDIRQAERGYSETMLVNLLFEIEDTHPEVAEVAYSFQGATRTLGLSAVRGLVGASAQADVDETIDLLLWYGFLGVRLSASGDEEYSYDVRYNIRRLRHLVETGKATLVVHPAFRTALGIA
jgi:hypothetical protein